MKRDRKKRDKGSDTCGEPQFKGCHMLMEQPLNEGDRVEQIAPRHTLLAGEPAFLRDR